MTINSLFRAQRNRQQQQADEVTLDGPVVSTILQHRLFLSKSKYNSNPDGSDSPALSSTTTVYLMQQTQPASQSKTKSSVELESPEPNTMSKSTSSGYQDEIFAGYPHDFHTRELPELLKIYVYGGFSDKVSGVKLTTNTNQHQEFLRLNFQTVSS